MMQKSFIMLNGSCGIILYPVILKYKPEQLWYAVAVCCLSCFPSNCYQQKINGM